LPPKSMKGETAGKRYPLNMRSTKELREQLERAAAQSGRSLVQEVEHRLERSFRDENVLIGGIGGPNAEPFVRPVLYFLESMHRDGKDWRTNQAVAEAMPTAIKIIAEAVFAGGLSLEQQQRYRVVESLESGGSSVRTQMVMTAISLLKGLGLAERPSTRAATRRP
jgi:hypothetical protein